MQGLVSFDTILEVRKACRVFDFKFVMTNGCFDLLHIGHIRYLEQARALGQVLVVAINSDESVRRLKGNLRPIVQEKERAEVIAALKCVDYTFIFDAVSPLDIITAIQPDVLVKGADWAVNDIIGKDIVEAAGGRVVTIPFVEGHSSSMLINKVLYLTEMK